MLIGGEVEVDGSTNYPSFSGGSCHHLYSHEDKTSDWFLQIFIQDSIFRLSHEIKVSYAYIVFYTK